MKMETSYYRRITVISIILLSLISIVSSLDFEIDYPKEVEVNSEFLVKLSSDTNINHDLKIFVEDDSRDFSEIYNNGWKSPFYYINNIFPEKKEFRILSHHFGETVICVKLRESEDKSKVSEKCDKIIVNLNQNNGELVKDSLVNINNKETIEIEKPNDEIIILNKNSKIQEGYLTKEGRNLVITPIIIITLTFLMFIIYFFHIKNI